jgi:hypothetical protein
MDQMLQSIEALLILGNLTEMADTGIRSHRVLLRLAIVLHGYYLHLTMSKLDQKHQALAM